MPTCYELWCEAVNLMSEGTAKPSYKTQTLMYLGVASQAVARIADALEGKNAASTAEYNRGKNEGLEEAIQRMNNTGFCQTSDYYQGMGDAIKICKDIQREIKGAENAAD